MCRLSPLNFGQGGEGLVLAKEREFCCICLLFSFLIPEYPEDYKRRLLQAYII